MQRIRADIQKVKKLINIARPIELPPLKSDVTKSDGSQARKKFELPLFGKKKTFGFDRLKQQAVQTKQASQSGNKVDEGESIEEFDEDENDTKRTEKTTESVSETAAKEIPIVETSKVATSCDDEIKESTDVAAATTATEKLETNERKIIEKKQSLKSKINDTKHHEPTPSQPSTEIQNTKNDLELPVTTNTKSKIKNRNRNKVRQQIDIDDTEEDTSPQKYSGWIPPSDQKGDGITDLNSKYGY